MRKITKHASAFLLMLVFCQGSCFAGRPTGNRPNGRVDTWDVCPTCHCVEKIRRLLAQKGTKAQIDACSKKVGMSPLCTIIHHDVPDLIEPLVSCGFGMNISDFLLMKLSSMAKFQKNFSARRSSNECDVVKELLRCGAICKDPTYAPLLMCLIPIQQLPTGALAPVAGWRTKTWRRMVTALLMVVHPRTGHQSPARQLLPCFDLFRVVAELVPVHMSMQDRVARRERKRIARGAMQE